MSRGWRIRFLWMLFPVMSRGWRIRFFWMYFSCYVTWLENTLLLDVFFLLCHVAGEYASSGCFFPVMSRGWRIRFFWMFFPVMSRGWRICFFWMFFSCYVKWLENTLLLDIFSCYVTWLENTLLLEAFFLLCHVAGAYASSGCFFPAGIPGIIFRQHPKRRSSIVWIAKQENNALIKCEQSDKVKYQEIVTACTSIHALIYWDNIIALLIKQIIHNQCQSSQLLANIYKMPRAAEVVLSKVVL